MLVAATASLLRCAARRRRPLAAANAAPSMSV